MALMDRSRGGRRGKRTFFVTFRWIPRRINSMKKTFLLFLAALAVIAAAFYAFNAYIYAEKQGDPGDVDRYRASLEGEVVCLPHVGDGPTTLECALGLRTDAGEHYALDFTLLSIEYSAPDTGARFAANGMVTPIEMLSSDHWQRYDVEGIFSVTDSPRTL